MDGKCFCEYVSKRLREAAGIIDGGDLEGGVIDGADVVALVIAVWAVKTDDISYALRYCYTVHAGLQDYINLLYEKSGKGPKPPWMSISAVDSGPGGTQWN
jgi:hypothetical protein